MGAEKFKFSSWLKTKERRPQKVDPIQLHFWIENKTETSLGREKSKSLWRMGFAFYKFQEFESVFRNFLREFDLFYRNMIKSTGVVKQIELLEETI